MSELDRAFEANDEEVDERHRREEHPLSKPGANPGRRGMATPGLMRQANFLVVRRMGKASRCGRGVRHISRCGICVDSFHDC